MGVWCIGVDLGGTKICGVAVDETGARVRPPLERPTQRQRPAAEIIATLVAMIGELAAGHEAATVGLGIPTTLDGDGGLVACPNLPTMAGVRLGPQLERELGQPLVLDNDANCFVYGEWRAGAAQATSVCCGVTLGTGFGMGMVMDGRLYRGGHGDAGEIWCAPFRDGRSVEDVLSGSGLGERYRGLTGEKVEAPEIARRARAADAEALAVWREYGEALGFALAYTVNILDPEVVVMGGSVAAARDLFQPAMGEVLQRYAYNYGRLRVVPAALGPVAGATGAALLAGAARGC